MKVENIKTLKDFNFTDKIVLVRIDLNLPTVVGKVVDAYRLEQVIPTIKHLVKNKAKVVLLSHYGRPENGFEADLSLAPLVNEISRHLKKDVKFAVDALSEITAAQVKDLKPGEIILLENLRFHDEEVKNSKKFAEGLASLGDIYVNETFSCSHRKHASIDGIPRYIPGCSGLLLEKELVNLKKYLEGDIGKVMSITGGSKVSTKIEMLSILVKKSDILVVGGAMANTFLKAKGVHVGNSLYEHGYIGVAKKILSEAKKHNCNVMLPNDVVTTLDIKGKHQCNVIDSKEVSEDQMILDVGPMFIVDIINAMHEVDAVIWNGPLGAFEHKPFDVGTATISRVIAELTNQKRLLSVAGGGDVAAAINNARLSQHFTFLSTGGGAFLEWLEGKKLPGVVALEYSAKKFCK